MSQQLFLAVRKRELLLIWASRIKTYRGRNPCPYDQRKRCWNLRATFNEFIYCTIDIFLAHRQQSPSHLPAAGIEPIESSSKAVKHVSYACSNEACSNGDVKPEKATLRDNITTDRRVNINLICIDKLTSRDCRRYTDRKSNASDARYQLRTALRVCP